MYMYYISIHARLICHFDTMCKKYVISDAIHNIILIFKNWPKIFSASIFSIFRFVCFQLNSNIFINLLSIIMHLMSYLFFIIKYSINYSTMHRTVAWLASHVTQLPTITWWALVNVRNEGWLMKTATHVNKIPRFTRCLALLWSPCNDSVCCRTWTDRRPGLIPSGDMWGCHSTDLTRWPRVHATVGTYGQLHPTSLIWPCWFGGR